MARSLSPVNFLALSLSAVFAAAALSRLVPAAVAAPEGGGKAPETIAEGQSCADCHGGFLKQRTVHNPVKDGQCEPCHVQDGKKHRFETAKDAQGLCLGCHEFPEGKVAHNPFAGGECLTCHRPHGSDEPRLLTAPERDLCLQCHEDVGTDYDKAPVKHLALASGKTCSPCHQPHSGEVPKLLRSAKAADLCAACHSKEIRPKGRKAVAPVSRQVKEVKEGASVHGPAAQGSCEACHRPHFSKEPRLLGAAYPGGIYKPFSEEAYGLCFQCHEAAAFTEAKSTDTGFRDGERNLHFLHVNRSKGRTCRACHDPHAAQGPHLVPESVTFGKWALPLGFETKAQGGSCNTGCHGKKEYAR